MKTKLWRACSVGAMALATLPMPGCRQDMHNQPKMIPQRHSVMFSDGRSARPQVAGTVSRSERIGVSYLTTGYIHGAEGDALPFNVTYALLQRGQERFNIYCSPCHSRVGNGKGAIVGRGYRAAGNFQSARLIQAPLGHFFSVITHGYGAMPNYSAEVDPVDRWAIAAYIRALQLSQNATRQDVPVGEAVHPMAELLQRANMSMNFLDAWDDSVDAAADTSATVPQMPAALASTTALGANTSLSPAPGGAAPTQPGKSSPSSIGAKGNEIASLKTDTNPMLQDKGAPAAPPAPKGDAAHGKTLYAANCSACHQPTRAGIPGMIPSLMGIVEKDGEAKVRKTIKEGIADAKPPMPPHPDFTDTDYEDLLAYLRTKE